MIEALKSSSKQNQKLIVISSPLVWSNTSPKLDGLAYTDSEINSRVPLPKYLHAKNIEQNAMTLSKISSVNVHIVCSGFLYGNGEQNDVFYEFFRCAWVSLHPHLAALPLVNGGRNFLPTIHVKDLANAVEAIFTTQTELNQYLIAADNSENQNVKDMMTVISLGIGSGATREVSMSEAINYDWCNFLSLNIKLQGSKDLLGLINWHCKNGISNKTIAMLNEEFNHFRGLFPLKVFITGPPCSGKTHFAKRLNELYGIPHIKINDIVSMGKALTNELGQKLNSRIDELKDQAEADYERTKKKKDPDFDRSTFNPRLPDDILYLLVQH